MDKEIMKKAALRGVGTGILTWLIYGLVFQMLIDGEDFKDALFDKESLAFLVVIIVVEIVLYYFVLQKKPKDQ